MLRHNFYKNGFVYGFDPITPITPSAPITAPCGGLKFDPEYFEIIDGVVTLKQSSNDNGG